MMSVSLCWCSSKACPSLWTILIFNLAQFHSARRQSSRVYEDTEEGTYTLSADGTGLNRRKKWTPTFISQSLWIWTQCNHVPLAWARADLKALYSPRWQTVLTNCSQHRSLVRSFGQLCCDSNEKSEKYRELILRVKWLLWGAWLVLRYLGLAHEKRMRKTLTSKSRKVLGWKENLVSTSYGSLEEQTDNLTQVSKACFVRFQSRTRMLIENCAGGH